MRIKGIVHKMFKISNEIFAISNLIQNPEIQCFPPLFTFIMLLRK